MTDDRIDILYLCDRKKRLLCSPFCHYTKDVRHAKNFSFSGTTVNCKGESFYKEVSCEEIDIMTMNEYQKLAMRTCSIPYEDTGAMLNHAIFGLTSEAGEVAGILQKIHQGHEADPEHMKKELGDCLWMIAEAATALGFDLEDIAATNIRKLKKRYPDGFDAERSLHRTEGDI